MSVYLKVKIKSLADEARTIRKEERKATGERRASLHEHRVNVVRPASRSTHLAYGFLRNTPYHVMEKTCHTEPDWRAVGKMVEKYGEGDADTLSQQLKSWREAA